MKITGSTGTGPTGPLEPRRPGPDPDTGADAGRFQEWGRLLEVDPEQALGDLSNLFDHAASRLTPVPGAPPSSLEGLSVTHSTVPSEDGGPDWTVSRLGEFTQRSRVVEGRVQVQSADGAVHSWDLPG